MIKRANWPLVKPSWSMGAHFNCVFVSFRLLLWQEKCAQYWPTAEEQETTFRDTRFTVALLSEDIKSYYTTRVLELQNISVSDGELGRFRLMWARFIVFTVPFFSCCTLPAKMSVLFKTSHSASMWWILRRAQHKFKEKMIEMFALFAPGAPLNDPGGTDTSRLQRELKMFVL